MPGVVEVTLNYKSKMFCKGAPGRFIYVCKCCVTVISGGRKYRKSNLYGSLRVCKAVFKFAFSPVWKYGRLR